MSEPRGVYLTGDDYDGDLLTAGQVDTLLRLLALVKRSGYGEVHIVIRDHRVETFRRVHSHRSEE